MKINEYRIKIGFFTKLLFGFSGVSAKILEDCPTEIAKYQSAGAAVFFTGVLAFITGSLSFNYVFQNIYFAVSFGLFWGFLIFNLDRYIVSSIILEKNSPYYTQFIISLPRIFLAIVIAFIISKPFALTCFKNEIEGYLEEKYNKKIADNENQRNNQLHSDPEFSRLEKKKTDLERDITSMQSNLNDIGKKIDCYDVMCNFSG